MTKQSDLCFWTPAFLWGTVAADYIPRPEHLFCTAVVAAPPPPKTQDWQPNTRPKPGIPIIPTGIVLGSQAASSNEIVGTTSKANAAAASSVAAASNAANGENRDLPIVRG